MYSNIINILYVIEKYIENHPEYGNLNDNFNINTIKIHELLKKSKSTITEEIKVCEALMVISFLSNRKDMYLEKISKLSEEVINFYIGVIENYYTPPRDDESLPQITENDCESDVSINSNLNMQVFSESILTIITNY